MNKLLLILICGMFVLYSTTVFAAEIESSDTFNKIKLTANKCNIIIEASEDNKVHYDYNKDNINLTTNVDDKTLTITVNAIDSDTIGEMIIIKISGITYDTIIMNGIETGIGYLAKGINANLEMDIIDGSGSLYIRKGFTKTVNISLNNCAGSVVFEEGATNYTIILKHKQSAIGSPSPNFKPNKSSPYKYISGNGDSKINLSIKNSAFSAVFK